MLSNIWLFDAVLAEVSTAQLATDCWAEAGAASTKHPTSKVPAQVTRRRDRTFIFHAPHGPLFPPPNSPTCTQTCTPTEQRRRDFPLSLQQSAGRIVAAVNHGVTVLAGPREHLHLADAAGEAVAEAAAVALVAQARPRHFQHRLVDRAVRVVAVEAVLAHRRVLEQERTALLGVALVAGVVDRGLAQQALGGAAVRVVAIGADDLAFAHRHVRRAIHLRAPVLVALEAGIGLERGLEIELHRHLAHDRVTIGAGKAARLVRPAAPVGAVASLVAGEADGVVLGRRAREIILAERDDAADAASAARLRVRRARTVAVLAFELALLILPDAPHQRFGERGGLARVAAEADLGADVGGFDDRGRLDRLGGGRGGGPRRPVGGGLGQGAPPRA